MLPCVKVKSSTFQAKKAIGVGLRPSLWERIDRWAEHTGQSRNAVIEAVLTAHIPDVADLRETQENHRRSQDRPLRLPRE